MFDTMTLTKIVAALCSALLFFLLLAWFGEAIYGGSGHDEKQAYVIDTGAPAPDAAAAAPEVPFADLLAAADPAAGERLFRSCAACHKVDGSNGTGPYLNGVVGRDIASVAGYAYSDALTGLPGSWTPEELSKFIENPRGYAGGTKMTYGGMKKPEDRASLIAYLGTTGG